MHGNTNNSTTQFQLSHRSIFASYTLRRHRDLSSCLIFIQNNAINAIPTLLDKRLPFLYYQENP